ncbi:MAG TPA: hypothetical protein VKV40_21690 [Ktedonobacteraceae bacterium]|nr:hypothetical protein [Ktedonobacteraceae bacterium]
MFLRLHRRAKALFVLSTLIATVAFVLMTTVANAAPVSRLPKLGAITPQFTTVTDAGTSSAVTSNISGTTIPHWSSAFNSGGTNYKYTMVGTNPSDGSVTTTIPTEIIPLDLSFANGIAFDGTKKVKSTLASPIFKPASFTSGNTQFGDAMQRFEFWTYVSTVSKKYHVLLGNPSVYPTVAVNVPASQGGVFITSTNVVIGLINYHWFGALILKELKALNIQPNTFPIFLTYNSLLYIGNTSNCCVIGFHGDTFVTSPGNTQTFAWASYTDPGIFSVPIDDINALSHEVAEWLNDPFVNNIVPAWSVPSEPQYGCSNLLEVGDPLVGVAYVLNGYHPQDIASFSWFARQSPAITQSGEYSYLGTFTTYSPPCSG